MKNFFLFTLIVINLTLMVGCKRGFSLSDTNTSGNGLLVEYTTASVNGRVIDLNGKPVSNAVISTGFNTTTTDVNGQFNLANIKLDKNASFVSVSKTGYFNGSKTFEISDNSKNYIEITLISKTISGTFNTSSGGNITVANGGVITFQANAVKDSLTGAIYTGTVSVSAYYINPANSNATQIMPGELRGIDSSNNEQGLRSFSMMAVELTGSAGQKLQLISGKPATITFPIPSSLQSSAPANIPLWYFDETKGLWKEQGTAAKQGNNYVGNVSHFSYWNCDAGMPIIKFNAVIQDNNGNPLSGIWVGFQYTSDSSYYRGDYTNSTGNIQGKIPANATLRLAVYSRCGNILYTQNVTTSGNDIDLGVIKVNTSLIPVTFSGTVKDCSGNNIAGGLVTVLLDGVYTTGNITNGTFSLTVNRCTANVSVAGIVAVDTSKNLQDTISVQNITSTNITNIALTPCTQSTEQYIDYTINNTSYSFVYPTDSLTYGIPRGYSYLSIWATRKSAGNDEVDIYLKDTVLGTRIGRTLYIRQSNIVYQSKPTDSITTTLTEFGQPIIGFIAGSFSGNLYTDTTSANATKYPVKGTFRLKRYY